MSWKVGKVEITPIIECWSPVTVGWLLPDLSEDAMRPHLDWLQPSFVDAELEPTFVVQSFLVRSEGKNIVVDTCIGNDKERTNEGFHNLQTDFLERFSKVCAPEDVDLVLCTHMHLDHVGWSTRLVGESWVPTFQNATYLYGEDEWAYWQSNDRIDYVLNDSVRPIFDAGLAKVVPSDHRVNGDIRLVPTPGHTPGHVAVWIESAGEQAGITGDLLHHPVQCAYPQWHCVADTDGAQAVETRRAFLQRCEDEDARLIGTHVAPPTIGRVRAIENGWRFETE